jgi:hypothetical protein
MMYVMILKLAREALRLAEKAFDRLSVCARDTDSDEFRDEFVSCIAMIGRVGPMIDSETKGCRTPVFGNWWKTTAQERLLRFITEVRNAEFKRGENRTNVHHYRYVSDSACASDTVSVGGELSGQPAGLSAKGPVQSSAPVAKSSLWFFSGGQYNGQEVIPLLRRHLDWLDQTVIPEAERLLASR